MWRQTKLCILDRREYLVVFALFTQDPWFFKSFLPLYKILAETVFCKTELRKTWSNEWNTFSRSITVKQPWVVESGPTWITHFYKIVALPKYLKRSKVDQNIIIIWYILLCFYSYLFGLIFVEASQWGWSTFHYFLIY